VADVTTQLAIYSMGLEHCSVCSPNELSRAEVEQSVNRVQPTNIESSWHISPEDKFATGEPHPTPCLEYPNRTHWLLDCLGR
jgi:hypothetical protein